MPVTTFKEDCNRPECSFTPSVPAFVLLYEFRFPRSSVGCRRWRALATVRVDSVFIRRTLPGFAHAMRSLRGADVAPSTPARWMHARAKFESRPVSANGSTAATDHSAPSPATHFRVPACIMRRGRRLARAPFVSQRKRRLVFQGLCLRALLVVCASRAISKGAARARRPRVVCGRMQLGRLNSRFRTPPTLPAFLRGEKKYELGSLLVTSEKVFGIAERLL